MKAWKLHDRRMILDHGKFLRVEEHHLELPDGRVIPDWPWVITPDYVNVVAMTGDGLILGFWQEKYAADGLSIAPVGGYIDEGEDPLTAAKRELLEETGYAADIWQSLGAFPCDSNRGCGTAHFFIAKGARRASEPVVDDLEEMAFTLFTLQEIEEALDKGRIKPLPWMAVFALALHSLRHQRGAMLGKEMTR